MDLTKDLQVQDRLESKAGGVEGDKKPVCTTKSSMHSKSSPMFPLLK